MPEYATQFIIEPNGREQSVRDLAASVFAQVEPVATGFTALEVNIFGGNQERVRAKAQQFKAGLEALGLEASELARA